MIGFNKCIIEAFWQAVFLLEYGNLWKVIHLITNIFHHEFAVFLLQFWEVLCTDNTPSRWFSIWSYAHDVQLHGTMEAELSH